MSYTAVIDRYMSNNFTKNTLTVIDKYPFEDERDAIFFVKNLKEIDKRILRVEILHVD